MSPASRAPMWALVATVAMVAVATQLSTAAPRATSAPAPAPVASKNAPPVAPAPRVAPTPLRESALFGAYANGLPYDDDAFAALEKKLGTKLPIASGFVDFEYVLGEARDLKLADGGNRKLLYSWEPHCDRAGKCISFRDIIDGRLDPYLERVANSLRQFPHEIYVRPWAEMNASWSPYHPGSGLPRAGSAEEFRAAFRHLYDFFRRRGVHNLKFVFNVDVSDDPEDSPFTDLWPGKDPVDGHAYADVLGLDGYNWGNSGTQGGNVWTEFEDVFQRAYERLTALDPHAPVWICEFGTKEPRKNDGTARSPAPIDRTHDKGAWFDGMLRSTAFPRVRALAYYSSYLPGHDNQRDFRLDSSESSLAAIRRHVQRADSVKKR